MSLRRMSSALGAMLILAAWAGPLHPCGPFFPNRVLLGGEDVVVDAPVAGFEVEVRRISPAAPPRFKALPLPEDVWYAAMDESYAKQTAAADVADLDAALAAAKRPAKEREAVVNEYRAARQVLLDYATARAQEAAELAMWGNEVHLTPTRLDAPDPPAGAPAEFADYLRGAVLFHQGKPKGAREAWLALLARPARSRHYRSTWAALMIGKTLLDSDPDQAIVWFKKTRQLAAGGYADSLGLASASYGWEGRALLNEERFNAAIERYVEQLATGDPRALTSLKWASKDILEAEPQHLQKAAKSRAARRVVTAYILSRSASFHEGAGAELSRKWLAAVERARVGTVGDADRLAWAAYQVGEMKLAEGWLKVAPAESPVAAWIRAKLLLRAGKSAEGTKALARLAAQLPAAEALHDWQWAGERIGFGEGWDLSVDTMGECVRGELGALYLGRRQYAEALDAFLRGGFWEDSAYVAERVLTPDELKAYVDRNWPPPGDERAATWPAGRIATGERIRYLLARRLARVGRWADARAYFPPEWRPRFDAYTRGVLDGRSKRGSRADRAAALWKAACIARYQGMELLGTEVEPDWSVYGGTYGAEWLTPTATVRGERSPAPLTSSTADERQRIRAHAVRPNKRYHYRYGAADLAWEAAALMPDQSEDTAKVLALAGSWLKNRDPKAADRFYKALVRRCGKTALGKKADELRWFPPVEEDVEKLIR
jgi:hypothetical protein